MAAKSKSAESKSTESKSTEDQPPDNIIEAADHGRLDLVTALLDGGADANTVDEIGTSALHNAAKRGHWHIARLLLEKNASPRLQDGNRATPLRLAVREGHTQIVRLFLECDPPGDNHIEMETDRLIRLAAARGHTEIVQLFLDCNTPTLMQDGPDTALHLAAKNGHHDVCELLLKHDKALDRSLWARWTGPSLEVDAKDYDGNTPFAWAVEKGHGRTVEIFLRNYPDLSKSCDRYKELNFHKVVGRKNIELVRIFLSCGTDIEMKNKYGSGALHEAVIAQNRYYGAEGTELIQFLLANGAAADAKDKSGRTPEFYAHDPKTRMLLRNNATMLSKGHPIPKLSAAPPPEYKA